MPLMSIHISAQHKFYYEYHLVLFPAGNAESRIQPDTVSTVQLIKGIARQSNILGSLQSLKADN